MASVPGSHRGPDYDKWGHRRLGHLLKKHVTIPSLLSPSESKESWPIIAQCSSIGALGADPDAWMCGELRTSMSQRAVQPGDMPQPPPKFKVVSSLCHTSIFLPQVFVFLFWNIVLWTKLIDLKEMCASLRISDVKILEFKFRHYCFS